MTGKAPGGIGGSSLADALSRSTRKSRTADKANSQKVKVESISNSGTESTKRELWAGDQHVSVFSLSTLLVHSLVENGLFTKTPPYCEHLTRARTSHAGEQLQIYHTR